MQRTHAPWRSQIDLSYLGSLKSARASAVAPRIWRLRRRTAVWRIVDERRASVRLVNVVPERRAGAQTRRALLFRFAFGAGGGRLLRSGDLFRGHVLACAVLLGPLQRRGGAVVPDPLQVGIAPRRSPLALRLRDFLHRCLAVKDLGRGQWLGTRVRSVCPGGRLRGCALRGHDRDDPDRHRPRGKNVLHHKVSL